MSYIQMENTKTTRLLFKGSYFCSAFGTQIGYVSGKVAKQHVLETPPKSLKTRQHAYP